MVTQAKESGICFRHALSTQFPHTFSSWSFIITTKGIYSPIIHEFSSVYRMKNDSDYDQMKEGLSIAKKMWNV